MPFTGERASSPIGSASSSADTSVSAALGTNWRAIGSCARSARSISASISGVMRDRHRLGSRRQPRVGASAALRGPVPARCAASALRREIEGWPRFDESFRVGHCRPNLNTHRNAAHARSRRKDQDHERGRPPVRRADQGAGRPGEDPLDAFPRGAGAGHDGPPVQGGRARRRPLADQDRRPEAPAGLLAAQPGLRRCLERRRRLAAVQSPRGAR